MYYKRILDALPELIYVTKDDGATSVFFNKAWYDYTGLEEKEALSGWGAVVDPHDTARVSLIIRKAVEKKEPYEVEVRLYRKSTGDFRWFLSRATPIINDNGLIEGYVGISIDTHEAKLSVQDMEKIYEYEVEKRLSKIKELERELEIHKSVK